MFQVEIRNVIGAKKSAQLRRRLGALRFHACAGREAGAGKLIPSARRGGTTDGDWHQPSNTSEDSMCDAGCKSKMLDSKLDSCESVAKSGPSVPVKSNIF